MPYYPPASTGGGGYTTIQDEGVALTTRTTIDFVGAGVTASDTGSKTQVSISGGGSGSPNTGSAILDFGAFPGKSDASIAVTGQASIVASSKIIVWLQGSTADHSEDEHMLETIKLFAGNVVAGTGFTIYGVNSNTLTERLTRPGVSRFRSAATTVHGYEGESVGGRGTRIYGQWSVNWMWV